MKELIKTNHELSVSRFFEQTHSLLQLTLVAGEKGLRNHQIKDHAVNRPALALTGYFEHFVAQRLQYIGFCELSYLLDLPQDQQIQVIERINALDVPCFVATDRIAIPQHLILFFEEKQLPLFTTHLTSGTFVEQATIFLDEYFSPTTVLSGTLVKINNTGVLIQGLPAIPKGICVVALLEKGHALVADEVVCISCGHSGNLFGQSKGLSQGFMEFRGIGLIKMTELLGIHSVRTRSTIDLVVRFEGDLEDHATRTGLEAPKTCTILDHELPLITMPICSGHDASRLIEIATLLQLLRDNGSNPVEELTQRLMQHMIDQESEEQNAS